MGPFQVMGSPRNKGTQAAGDLVWQLSPTTRADREAPWAGTSLAPLRGSPHLVPGLLFLHLQHEGATGQPSRLAPLPNLHTVEEGFQRGERF